MQNTSNWRYSWKIAGLLLAVLGTAGGKAILELYARKSITFPEEIFAYIPEFLGLAYCLLILISGIIIFSGWNWHRLPSMKVLLIFALVNGITAILLGYFYGHAKIPVRYGRFAGENDLVWITVLAAVGMGIVVFIWLPVFVRFCTDLRYKSFKKSVISGSIFAIFGVLLAGYIFPLFFDAAATGLADHNLKVAIRQSIDKKFGFVTYSDLGKMTILNVGTKTTTVYSGPDYAPPQWTPTGSKMATAVLSMEDNYIGNIEGIEHCANLETLNLGFNWCLQDITFLKDLNHLTRLKVNANLKDITPLTGLTQLTYLDLWGTHELEDIQPLKNLDKLSVFIAWGCSIQDISSLQGLSNLSWLNIGSNKITDIAPLVQNSGLGEGDKLDLRYNPLNDISINVYIPELRARGVEVQWEPRKHQ
jgi:hypothetical protein